MKAGLWRIDGWIMGGGGGGWMGGSWGSQISLMSSLQGELAHPHHCKLALFPFAKRTDVSKIFLNFVRNVGWWDFEGKIFTVSHLSPI